MQETTTERERELNTYFAVLLRPGETPHKVAEVVLRTAKALGIMFRRLEVLDTTGIGVGTYVRLRADLVNPFPVLERLFTEGRSLVCGTPSGAYELRLQGGRIGKVSSMIMHATPKPGQTRMYLGPKMKRWEAQFE